MIYIVYTTKAKKEQRKFSLIDGNYFLFKDLRRSPGARKARLGLWQWEEPSLEEYIKCGVDLTFEATTPEDEAFVTIIPYEKHIRGISDIYRKWKEVEKNNSSIYQIVKGNLIAGKYENLIELFEDIREMYKKSATSMESFYAPMIGSYTESSRGVYHVSTETLYDNIEQIEAAIQNSYALEVIQCSHLSDKFKGSIIAAECHADLAKKCPLLHLEVYFNQHLTSQEIDEFITENFENAIGIFAHVSLPGIHYPVEIYSYGDIMTTEEVNKKYF
jgi:hypothetical protein